MLLPTLILLLVGLLALLLFALLPEQLWSGGNVNMWMLVVVVRPAWVLKLLLLHLLLERSL